MKTEIQTLENPVRHTCVSLRYSTVLLAIFSGLLQVLQAVDSFSVTNDAALELIKGILLLVL